jgi:hypothetical protein
VKSPLAEDEKLVKEFGIGINESGDLDALYKLGYVRAQIDEFKKVMFRNRVDAVISQDLIERCDKDNNIELGNEARKNLANYRNVIKQMNGAVEVMEKFKSELEPLVTAPTE